MLTGCQTTTGLYDWGSYEDDLYRYYKDPAQLANLEEGLLLTIEQANDRVPPGLYAEYGTLMLQKGNTTGAVTYYQKEREKWPESAPVMDAMINTLTKSPSTNKGK